MSTARSVLIVFARPQVWFRIHPHAPAARLFLAYSQALGAELPMLRFMHCGRRMDGAQPLAEHHVEDEDEARRDLGGCFTSQRPLSVVHDQHMPCPWT
jgi:hypothetical protein